MKIINRLIFLIVIAAGLYGFYYIQYGGNPVDRGDKYLKKMKYDKAISEYLKEIENRKNEKIEPDNELLLKIADTYEKLEKYESAIPYFKLILKRKKDHLQAQFGLAFNLYKGNFKGAKKEFNDLLRLVPSHSLGNYYLAKIFLGNENYSSALKHLKMAKDTDDSNIEIYKLISIIYKHKKNIEAGIDICEEGIKINPECSELYSNLGFFYILDKEYEKGRKECNTAIGLDYKSAQARHHLGLCCFGTKLIDAAEKQFEEALKNREDYPLPHYMLGIIEFQKKNFKKSLEHYEKALEIVKEHKKTKNFYYSPELIPSIKKGIESIKKLKSSR